jgi:hypothetical protein
MIPDKLKLQWGCLVLEHILDMHEALGSIPSTRKKFKN